VKIELALAIFVLQVTFFAAVFWATTRTALRQIGKDQNGIADKGRQTELKLFYVAMMLCPEEKRQEVLNALVRKLT
jgi:hypothetical protein